MREGDEREERDEDGARRESVEQDTERGQSKPTVDNLPSKWKVILEVPTF